MGNGGPTGSAAAPARPVDIDALIGHTTVLTVLGTLPVLAAACTLGVLAAAVLAWRGRWWTTAVRLHRTAVALAAVAFLAVVWQYDLSAPLWT